MKYLVAVSGGIDSVVLLDMLVADKKHDLIVAHFDHGIREDSANDARFVAELATKYGLPFVGTREELGKGASEERARARRYAFLEDQARKHGAVIATAHHADDVIETIAINLIRGTGWRGVAVMGREGIVRPLLHLHEQHIREYATARRLEWVEDSTNSSEYYMRNRVRRKLAAQLNDRQRRALLGTWKWQVNLKQKIDKEILACGDVSGKQRRHLYIMIDATVAAEMLRAVIIAKTGVSATRPQLDRAVMAIKTAKSGSSYELGGQVTLRFTTDSFVVETP